MDNLNLLITLYSDHYQRDSGDINRDAFNNITWSPFDRIVFTKVHSHKELCSDNYSHTISSDENSDANSNSLDGNEHNHMSWNGVKQCMHLIEERFDCVEQYSSNWELQEKNDQDQSNKKSIFLVTNNNENRKLVKKDYAFHCIYSMRFSNTIQHIRCGNHIYDKKLIRKEVFKKIWHEVLDKDMDFRCFRSLGSEDMVILFLSNSMKDIVTTVDYINRLKVNLPSKAIGSGNDKIEELFSTVCVFSGFNNPNYSDDNDLDLIVHLNLKRNNPNDVINELKRTLNPRIHYRTTFLGMGAIKLYIRAGKITYKAFHDDGVLNGKSKFYKENIYSSRTHFCIPRSVSHRIIDEDKLIIKITNLNELSLLTTDTDEKDLNHNSRMSSIANPVADFVFGEYERLLSSQRTIQWYETLSRQYMAVKSFVDYYSAGKYKFDECAILNYAQSSLHLINQACSPVSEIPNHNHFYAGSFHDLIKAYYGIINMLFNLAYNLPHAKGTIQHPVTFAICLNAVARIESKIFTRNDDKNRIIIFFLPYDSFWNYADNIKALVHEVFHYVAPYDRKFRASCIVKIIYSCLVVDRISLIVKDKIPTQSLKGDIPNEIDVSYKIKEWIEYIVNLYNKIEADLIKMLSKYFPGFFVHSNPEWCFLFFNDSSIKIYDTDEKIHKGSTPIIDDVIMVIDNYVKQVINEYHEDAMKHISYYSSIDADFICKTFTSETVKKKIMLLDNDHDLVSNTYRAIRRKLRTYNLTTKEAFCDLWSIKISGLKIPEYLSFLLKTMSQNFNPNSILEGIDANQLHQTQLDIRGTVIRMLILIHKYVNDEGIVQNSEAYLANLLLEKSGCSHGEDKAYISQCFTILVKKYIEYTTVAKYEIEAVCNIAFHMVDEIFSHINLYDKFKCCNLLKQISATDLSTGIRMDQIDNLSNFVGMSNPKKKASRGKPTAFINYARIGEDKSYKMHISSFGEFMEAVDEISKKVSKRQQNHILWYRGVCSDRFSLLPSIFRKGDSNLSIYANQANVIKRAYFSTLYASDIWSLPIEQRMAYLQHYGMPTNLLDFSIDPLAALHFAITPDVAADQQKISDGLFQPVVYVFDPMVYSRAIRRMTEWNPELQIPDTISAVNFDINGNLNERNDFFVDDMSYDYLYEHNKRHTKVYSPNDRGDPFPVPIVIQQSNQRIIAQSGTFVAFSLHAQPQKIKGESNFEYLNLLRIQERYFNFLHETTNFEEQFIFPIFIRKSYISNLKKDLRYINISGKKFYPELNKVFEDTNQNGFNDGI